MQINKLTEMRWTFLSLGKPKLKSFEQNNNFVFSF